MFDIVKLREKQVKLDEIGIEGMMTLWKTVKKSQKFYCDNKCHKNSKLSQKFAERLVMSQIFMISSSRLLDQWWKLRFRLNVVMSWIQIVHSFWFSFWRARDAGQIKILQNSYCFSQYKTYRSLRLDATMHKMSF